MDRRHLLILGGTAEAAELAEATVQRWPAWRVTSSLAGRTTAPAPLQGDVRIGGFGGVEGLERYLAGEAVTAVVDATHPFAVEMSAHARIAAERQQVPRLRFWRTAWRRDPRDRWVEVADAPSAARALARVGRRVFLTLGQRDLGAFSGLTDSFFLVRMIEPPATPPPLPDHHLVLARGPFTLAQELALMRHHRIDALVAKASGGAGTEAKIEAARGLDIPVVLIRRPRPEPGPLTDSIAGVIAWLEAIA
jgi:precorrin-6A/cobalt-precorrin-6A reductase